MAYKPAYMSSYGNCIEATPITHHPSPIWQNLNELNVENQYKEILSHGDVVGGSGGLLMCVLGGEKGVVRPFLNDAEKKV
jgi:hypothetical protein